MRFQGQFAYCFLIVLLVNLHGSETARYIGRSEGNAGQILDNSQNRLCHRCNANAYGHPRGHASHPGARGPLDSVENYSRSTGSQKSGFLSRADQNLVAHRVLQHSKSRDAMIELNSGGLKKVVILAAGDIGITAFPKMREYRNGKNVTRDLDIKDVVIVLRHHAGRSNDRYADVFVETFYPRKA